MADNADKSKLPSTWTWYGEAIKWFITIAAGLLAFGFDYANDGKLIGWTWWVSAIGAVALGVSAVVGLFAYLQLLGAANLLEIDKPSAEQIGRRDKHHGRFTLFYQISVGSLGVGIATSAIAWLAAARPQPADPKPTPYTIESIGTEQNPTLIRRAGTRVEVLTIDAAGKLVWREVSAPTTTQQ